MNLKFFSKKQSSQMGIEISPEGIVAVQLKKEKNEIVLEKLSKKVFESRDVVQNGQIINQAEFIKTLTSMITEDGITAKTVNISVPSSNTFIKTITLPDLPIGELKSIAYQEASTHIPFSPDEVNIDIDIIETSKRVEKDGKKVDVVLVALQKSSAKELSETVSKVGLNVQSIDISAFSVIRTLAGANLIEDNNELYASVLIGYENTDINIIQKGMPVFSNNVPIGKKNLIDSLINSLDLSIEEIESILPEVALIIPGASILQEGSIAKASTIAKNVYNSILQEAEKTIEFYLSQLSEEKEIKTIIISGPGVCVQNIDKYFINKLKTFSVLCNSIQNLSTSLKGTENLIYPLNIPALAPSVGLALKGL